MASINEKIDIPLYFSFIFFGFVFTKAIFRDSGKKSFTKNWTLVASTKGGWKSGKYEIMSTLYLKNFNLNGFRKIRIKNISMAKKGFSKSNSNR